MTKTILVTGASSGVGEATAKLFAARGWNVVATGRNPAKFASWPSADAILTLALDVTDEASIQHALEAAQRRFGAIDVVVNNAGVGVAGPLEAVADAQLRRIFDTNVFGVAAMIRAIVPLMRRQKSGTIINVTSITGRLGLPFMSPYDSSKFAVEGLSESLRYELSLVGLRIKIVEPGGVKTAFSHQWSRHEAYEPAHQKLIDKMTSGAAVAKGPAGVARVIYKAATDRSDRLRYTANGSGPLLALHRLLPDALWRRVVHAAFLKGD